MGGINGSSGVQCYGVAYGASSQVRRILYSTPVSSEVGVSTILATSVSFLAIPILVTFLASVMGLKGYDDIITTPLYSSGS